MSNCENWLLFRDDSPETTREWELKTGAALSDRLGCQMRVHLGLPTKAESRCSWERNLDLRGRIFLQDDSGHSAELELHLPYDGVFIYANKMGSRPHIKVWKSWLTRDVLDKNKKDKRRTRGGDSDTDLTKCRLNTFPYWLKERLCSQFEDLCLGKKRCAKRNWYEETVLAGLVCHLVFDDALIRIDPQSSIQLVGEITGVRRFWLNRRVAERISIDWRQNHDSFEGRICPIETPESEMVGLTLQMARGARVDSDGRIVAVEFDGHNVDGMLSWGTSLIPFSHHNDGARNMMGAKNLRQAVPLWANDGEFGGEPPIVRSGTEDALESQVANLVDIGICPKCRRDGSLAIGKNLLVAYMPWKGWNVDDAVVVSETAAHSMGMKVVKWFSEWIESGWYISGGALKNVLAGGSVDVHAGDVIVEISGPQGRVRTFEYSDVRPATIFCVQHPGSDVAMYPRKIEYKIEKIIPLGVGDKVMGRHGNKGVVAKVLPDLEMPAVPDATGVPNCFKGKAVDILLNPNGVLSRMNPGQLLETHVGWLLKGGVARESALVVHKDYGIGAPLKGQVRHQEVRRFLTPERSGLDAGGALKLLLPGGRVTEDPVVTGVQYFVRLNHVPELKAQARRGGCAASYSTNTLQAAHGRKRGGGQRVGEMEVWALAAHGAHSILSEMLGEKSDVLQATGRAKGGVGVETSPLDSGFGLVLRDKLRALCIDSKIVGGKLCLSWLGDKKNIVESCGGESHGVTSECVDYGVIPAYAYECPKCAYVFANGRTFPKQIKGKGDYLTVDRMLVGMDLLLGECRGSQDQDRVFFVEVEDRESRILKAQVRLKCVAVEATSMRVVLCPIQGGGSAWLRKVWPVLAEDDDAVRFKPVHCYLNRPKVKAATDLIDGLCDPRSDCYIGNYFVVCPTHRVTALKTVPGSRIPAGRAEMASPNGIFDPRIFGSLFHPLGPYERNAWGYVELPFSVDVPMSDVYDLKNDRAARSISIVPILPLRYRMPNIQGGWISRIGELNAAYHELLIACRKEDATAISRAVSGVFKVLTQELRGGIRGQNKGKDGLIRKQGLGRRVDRSFRLVITPDPELNWDQVGVPLGILWEIMGDKAAAYCHSEIDVVQGNGSQFVGWDWHGSESTLSDEVKRQCLEKYLDERPETCVLLNRQPSLHRDSFQAFKPKILPDGAALTLHISPLCCKGFGADFDGDEMVGHYPVSDEAQEDAVKLLPENNPVSVATGSCLANCDRDFLLGSHLLIGNDHGRDALRNVFKSICEDGQAATYMSKLTEKSFKHACEDVLKALSTGVLKKTEQEKLKELGKLKKQKNLTGQQKKQVESRALKERQKLTDGISLWARTAYGVCTDNGSSFGFYDLIDNLVDCTKLSEQEVEEYKKAMSEHVVRKLENSLERGARSGIRAVGRMVLSGANGGKQIHQIIGERGLLSDGKNEKVYRCNLANGMEWRDYFETSKNARRSMCEKKLSTSKAGYLTRRLVLALWPIKIVEGVSKCQSNGGVCQKCYGTLSNGELAPIGYPAGLIAAQSIGERGTQLSMKSAHSGGNEVDVNELVKIINEAKSNGWKRFYEKITKNNGVYEELDLRHLGLLFKALSRLNHDVKGDCLRALAAEDDLTQFVMGNPLRVLFEAVEASAGIGLDSPFAQILFYAFRKEVAE